MYIEIKNHLTERSSGNWGLGFDEKFRAFLACFVESPSKFPFTPNSAHRWRYMNRNGISRGFQLIIENEVKRVFKFAEEAKGFSHAIGI